MYETQYDDPCPKCNCFMLLDVVSLQVFCDNAECDYDGREHDYEH